MWKLIKWLFILGAILLIVAMVKGYKLGGKTVQEHVRGFIGAENYNDGVKDIRSLVGEAIKAVGDAVSPEVTEKEEQELKNVIKKELEEAGHKQEYLPPETGKK
ncbi:MAG: hypothetical protein COS89_01660 [Deltaproteobacteria bacterium CG07_land_8_20_14_0_80_38_7]|nr:MAG: hypothetical protein COS89_01660 [Deltaproteobacteria bacterium CG07_land_8_20_14_0_80_38_7]